MIETVDATLEHVRALVRNLRAEDRAEIAGLGLNVRHTVHGLYRDSVVRRAALVDGEVGAVWGLQGSLTSDVGFPWLFTTPAVERVRFGYFRVAITEIGRMLEMKRRLVSRVASDYERSIRTFRMLGFEIGEPEMLGPYGLSYRTMTLGD